MDFGLFEGVLRVFLPFKGLLRRGYHVRKPYGSFTIWDCF